MRKTITASLLAITCMGFGQVTINSYDFLPSPRLYVMGYDTNSANPGNAGPGQVWNFSYLQADFKDSISVLNPSWTPYANLFPGCNLALTNPSNSFYYEYLENSGEGFYLHGTVYAANNPPDVSYYTPPAKYFSWPMNYLDNFSDSGIYISNFAFTGPYGVDTIRYIHHYVVANLVDAWGQLITPLGSFNCLRQKKTDQSVDSIWYYSAELGTWTLTNVSEDTVVIYDWLSNNASTGFILASITHSGTQYSGTYWLMEAMAGEEEQSPELLADIFPNPVTDHLRIVLPVNGNFSIEIYDPVGKRVYSAAGAGENSIYMGYLASGFYTVRITDRLSGSSISRKIIKS